MDEFENTLTGAEDVNFENLFSMDDDGGTTLADDLMNDENPEREDAPAADLPQAEAEPLGEQAPEAEQDQPETQEPENGTKPAEELTLKFYGQEVKLPKEQVVALAQKGLDYDKVRAERDSLKNGRERQLLSKYAAASNMDLPQYLDYLESAMEGAAVKKEVDAGMPEEQARELLRLRQNEAQRRAELRAQEQQREQNAQYVALLREYPDVKELPPEVVRRIAEGETPLAAYRAYDLARTKAALEAEKAAQKAKAAAQRNRETAPGSAVGIGGKDKADKFLEGFESGFIY